MKSPAGRFSALQRFIDDSEALLAAHEVYVRNPEQPP
jgi:hypothetical protein